MRKVKSINYDKETVDLIPLPSEYKDITLGELFIEAPLRILELIKCTGIEDKKGALIWEWDLVRQSIKNKKTGKFKTHILLIIHEDIYLGVDKDKEIFLIKPYVCERIGSFFEHKDLFKY